MQTKKLLIIQADFIGDYIIFRNFIEILVKSEQYKNYKIDMLCDISWYELAQELDKKNINNFFSFDREKYRVDNWYKINLENRLNLQKYSVVLYVTTSRIFLVDTLISHLKIKTKIGCHGDLANISLEDKKNSDKYYTKLVEMYNSYLFEFDKYKSFFENLLNKTIQLDKTTIQYENFVKPPFDNYIVFVVGARALKRKYSIENYVYLAKKLYHLGYNIVLCGGDAELEVVKSFKNLFGDNFINLVGKTSLVDMLSILYNCEFVISNDTGLAHMSIALKKQTFIVSNGNHFGRFIPYPKQYDKYVHCFFPFYYKKDFEYFCYKYYYNSNLNIDLVDADEIFKALPISKKATDKPNYERLNILNLGEESFDFSAKFNKIYQQINNLNGKIVIYGNGTIGKTIQALIPDKIIGYVDIADENHHPKNLLNIQFDKIIISVLGREYDIIKYLLDNLKIDKNKIIVLEI